MPFATLMSYLMIIFGIITMIGSCYNAQWYWNWTGKPLFKVDDEKYPQAEHFFGVCLFLEAE